VITNIETVVAIFSAFWSTLYRNLYFLFPPWS